MMTSSYEPAPSTAETAGKRVFGADQPFHATARRILEERDGELERDG